MHSPASCRPLALRGLNCRKAPFLCDPDVTSVAAIAVATRAPCKLWDCKKVPNTWVAGRLPLISSRNRVWPIPMYILCHWPHVLFWGKNRLPLFLLSSSKAHQIRSHIIAFNRVRSLSVHTSFSPTRTDLHREIRSSVDWIAILCRSIIFGLWLLHFLSTFCTAEWIVHLVRSYELRNR